MSDRLLYWAKSEAEAAQMQANGWQVGQTAIFHHNAYAILLFREGLQDATVHYTQFPDMARPRGYGSP